MQEYQELVKLRESLDNIYDTTVSNRIKSPSTDHNEDTLSLFSMSNNEQRPFNDFNPSSLSQMETELTESERLKLPLVGIYGNSNNRDTDFPSQNSFISGSDSDTINIVLEPIIENDQSTPKSPPQVMAIYPESDSEAMKRNISSLLGLDLNQIIQEVKQM